MCSAASVGPAVATERTVAVVEIDVVVVAVAAVSAVAAGSATTIRGVVFAGDSGGVAAADSFVADVRPAADVPVNGWAVSLENRWAIRPHRLGR